MNTPIRIPVVTSSGAFYFLPHEIICCQASSNYTWFHLTGERKVLVAKTLGYYEGLLPATDFLRIHHAAIVNKMHILRTEKRNAVWLSNGSCFSISRRRRHHVLNQCLLGSQLSNATPTYT